MSSINYQVQSSVDILLDVHYYGVETQKFRKPKALVQILHGMQEHKGRYEGFASFLAENGYAVVIHDHLGHGLSTSNKYPLGNMVGFEYVLRDVHLVRKSVDKIIDIEGAEDLPYILMGHSMGSFIARTYASKAQVDYLILSGTGQPSKAGAFLMKLMAKFSKKDKPLHHIQNILDRQLTKGFNPSIQWLSYNENNQRSFIKDPLCGNPFMKEGYITLSDFIIYINTEQSFRNCSAKEILMLSGADDPLGDYTKGVKKIAAHYQKEKKKVSSIFYENMTHEILNETDKVVVYTDILAFLERVSLCID